MSTVTRELKITYGSTVVGGVATAYLLEGQYGHEESYPEGVCAFSVLCVGTSEADFATQTTALVAAFRQPHQALLVELGSETLLSWNPAAGVNTALDVSAEISKRVGDPRNTGRTRVYDVVIKAGLPADRSGDNGLQAVSITLGDLPTEQRTLRIEGIYTALGTNLARAQFNAQFDTFADAIKTSFTGSWSRGPTASTNGKQDKTIRFERTYTENVFNQAEGVLNHPAIENHNMVISRTSRKDAHSIPGTVQPVELVVSWDCDVVISETTDLKALYEETVEPYMIAEARRQTGAGTIALLQRSPEFHKRNHLGAAIRVLAYTGSGFVTSLVTTTDEEHRGIEFVRVHGNSPHLKYTYPVPGDLVRTTRTRVVAFKEAPFPLAVGGSGAVARVQAANNDDLGAAGGELGIFGIQKAGSSLFKIGGETFGPRGQASINVLPGSSGGSAGAGGQGGVPPAQIPGLAEANGGDFVPFFRRVSRSPLETGLPPYDVDLVEAIEEVSAMYVETPPPGRVATGGTSRGRIESVAP